MDSYKVVDFENLSEGDKVLAYGVHVLRWNFDEWGEPQYAIVPVEEKPIENGFTMLWLCGNKYLVGSKLAEDVAKSRRQTWTPASQPPPLRYGNWSDTVLVVYRVVGCEGISGTRSARYYIQPDDGSAHWTFDGITACLERWGYEAVAWTTMPEYQP